MIDNIQWLGHGGFLIQGPPFIFIDPWRVVRTAFHADVILISHHHYDHCSIADIEKLRGPHTQIISNEKVAEQITGTHVIRPWQSVVFDRVSIKAIPAYAPDSAQHPRENGGLGFIISMNYYDIYYAGDTQLIPEMEHVRPDIAILPIDGKDTLSIDEAVTAVERLGARWVLPSNWGSSGEGASPLDALAFKTRVGDRAEVRIASDSSSSDAD